MTRFSYLFWRCAACFCHIWEMVTLFFLIIYQSSYAKGHSQSFKGLLVASQEHCKNRITTIRLFLVKKIGFYFENYFIFHLKKNLRFDFWQCTTLVLIFIPSKILLCVVALTHNTWKMRMLGKTKMKSDETQRFFTLCSRSNIYFLKLKFWVMCVYF